MSSEDDEFVYDLNFMKIDYNNNVNLIDINDIGYEIQELFACIAPFKEESIEGILLKTISQFIPIGQDLLKLNIEQSKQFNKFLLSDKNKYYESVNRILSTDFKEMFIFNKQNIQDVTKILTNSLNEIRKYKINNFEDLKSTVNKINFKKYNFEKLFLSNDNILKRNKTISSIISSKRGSFPLSVSKEAKIATSKFIDNDYDFINRSTNKKKDMIYIDNNCKNIINSSRITSDYDYNEVKMSKKILTKECFTFPNQNSKEGTSLNNIELPLDLIILLYKLKNVKCLIFQVNDVDEEFVKMATFIFLNIKWLFIHQIEEIKFDFGNENLQKKLNEVFNKRASELYHNFNKLKNSFHYMGNYKARTKNCWEPEGDIFFENETIKNKEKNNNNNYIYNNQPNKEGCTFDNDLCNIYNEYGNLTNIKYIRPIIYTSKNKLSENQKEKKNDNYDIFEHYLLGENIKIPDRESVYISSTNNLDLKNNNSNQVLNQNNINNNKNNVNNNFSEMTTPSLLKNFVKNNIHFFKMIAIYTYFFNKEFNKLNKLSLYFETTYSFEIQLLFRIFNKVYDTFDFFVFINKINSLTEANFSFNSLDNKSFENILGIISNNPHLISLKMSFFTPDINYFDNSLFNIWSSKKLSIRKLFNDQKEFLIKFQGVKERNLNYFILNHKKFLEAFSKNLKNFFNLLKINTLNNLKELVFRFDIPLSILNNEKYIILLIKFLINILIMITFLDNSINTLKILAPELPFDSKKMPFIKELFNEIYFEGKSLDVQWEEKMKNEKKKKEKKKIKEKEIELKEQRIKEFLEKEKNERKNKLQNINIINNSSKDVSKDNEQTKDKNDDINIDKDDKSFNFNKRSNSLVNKKNNNIEKEARKNETVTYIQRSELNKNTSLENLTFQFKIYNLPEIFNFCLMNNLTGIKSINLGYLDETTFIGFMESYKLNSKKLLQLTSLKISLGPSVISYNNLEKDIIEYINTNSPKLDEKFLLTDLRIVSKEKMNELVELVYYKATVPKLVFQIGNDAENSHLLSKVIYNYIKDIKNQINIFIMIMERKEYKKIFTPDIITCLASFYSKKNNRSIFCKENPDNPCN